MMSDHVTVRATCALTGLRGQAALNVTSNLGARLGQQCNRKSNGVVDLVRLIAAYLLLCLDKL